MFGYTAAEAIGQSIRMIIPPERQAEEDYVLSQIRRGEGVDHFETVRQTQDGRRLEISLTISPIWNAQGVIVGASKAAPRHRPQEALGARARRTAGARYAAGGIDDARPSHRHRLAARGVSTHAQ